MPNFRPLRNRKSWGAPRLADNTWTPYKPTVWDIHWGGVGPYRTATDKDLAALYASWRRYHMRINPATGQPVMRDIAYNYGQGSDEFGIAFRLRGENQNGANKGSGTPPYFYGRNTRAFVFALGKNSDVQLPSLNARLSFARLWVIDPLPVTGHGLKPGQNTECPGPLKGWIASKGWLTDLGSLMPGDKSLTVQALKKRLKALGYRRIVGNDRYGAGMVKQVKRYQADRGLPADGIVNRAFWESLQLG